ncbi:hypothetical protein [Microtetraspora niveoalba]|uniref:hypothetical protein n=1 Tax=Microtetraspora niveoalba TaxID=46175 RepID=UPI0008338FBE|nr:hypothetical protein [Microtetraspora niveoalba]
MPRPLDPTVRAAILNDIRAGQKSARQIGRDHGVATSTVSRLAKTTGEGDGWQRSQTEKATRAKQADNRSRRAHLASLALDDADAMRRRALTSEAGRDARDFATAYGIFIDKHATLERFDHDGGADHAKSMIGELADALRTVADQLPDDA